MLRLLLLLPVLFSVTTLGLQQPSCDDNGPGAIALFTAKHCAQTCLTSLDQLTWMRGVPFLQLRHAQIAYSSFLDSVEKYEPPTKPSL